MGNTTEGNAESPAKKKPATPKRKKVDDPDEPEAKPTPKRVRKVKASTKAGPLDEIDAEMAAGKNPKAEGPETEDYDGED